MPWFELIIADHLFSPFLFFRSNFLSGVNHSDSSISDNALGLQRTGIRCPRHRRQSCACQILPFEKSSTTWRRIEGIAYSERRKSLWEGSLAENKETKRCVYFMIFMLMNSSSSYYRRYHPLQFTSRGIQTLFRPHSLPHRWLDGIWSHALLCSHVANGRVNDATTELTREARYFRDSSFGVTLLRWDHWQRVRIIQSTLISL